MVLDLAEAAARAIITKHKDAVEALAWRFFNAPSGGLLQDEIEEVLDSFRPFDPPPAPLPVSWARLLSRVARLS